MTSEMTLSYQTRLLLNENEEKILHEYAPPPIEATPPAERGYRENVTNGHCAVTNL